MNKLQSMFILFSVFVQYVSMAPYRGHNVVNIVGGHLAKKGEYPYQVSIRSKLLDDPHICGGSIIDSKHVLTAAHCCRLIISDTSNKLEDFYIGAGVIDKSDTAHMVKKGIDSYLEHPQYNHDTFQNDICLINIKGEFTFNKLVQSVALSTGSVNEGTHCDISGWGFWSEQSYEQPDRLKGALVPIADQNQCVTNYTSVRTVHLDSMLCAGYPKGGTDACTGDSGGPLVCNKKLTGIVSWGKGCAEPNYPGIYTRVEKYVGWLRQHGVKTFNTKVKQHTNVIL